MSDPLALIIEDEPDLVVLFEHALRAAGYQTEYAERGDVALDRLAEVVPQIVILDLYLPGISGVTILHHIHTDERLANTHVIIISADALLAQTLEHDADLVLLKPVSYTQLVGLAQRLRSPVSPEP